MQTVRAFVYPTIALVAIAGIILGYSMPSYRGNEPLVTIIQSDVLNPAEDVTNSHPSVSLVQVGLTGDIETDITVTKLADGEDDCIILGTSKGIYILYLQEDSLHTFISTPAGVTKIITTNDLNGDSRNDIVVITDNTCFANVRCYSSGGENLWTYSPTTELFDEEILWTDIQTPSFDIASTTDIDGDNCPEVVVTSGYSLYMLSCGQGGDMIWEYTTDANLWRAVAVSDIDGDSISEVAVGSQDGSIHLVSGKTGKRIWKKTIVEECTVYDDSGDEYGTIDRSVWDIIPIEIDGFHKIIVSAEDGKVRIINLGDGGMDWESDTFIDYVASSLYAYYMQNQKYPTGPRNNSFFNLQLSKVEDISGDGTPEIIAATYLGAGATSQSGGQNGYQSATSGLFLVDPATETTIWENRGELTALDLSCIARIETMSLGGQTVLLVPNVTSGDMALLSLVEGDDLGSISLNLASQSTRYDMFRVKEVAENEFLLVSDEQDLLLLSAQDSSATVEWNYPRITGVAMQRSNFTGDETLDLLIYSKQRQSQSQSYGTRCLYVIDGATEQAAWSPYEMTYNEFALTGGICDIQTTVDLNGDNYTDIIGHIQSSTSSKDPYGENSRIIAISGNDGSVLLEQTVVTSDYYHELYTQYTGKNPENPDTSDGGLINKRIASLGIMENSCLATEPVIIVGCERNFFILSIAGDLLWTRTYESHNYRNLFNDPDNNPNYEDLESTLTKNGDMWGNIQYQILGDVSGDGYDDLMAAGDNCIILAESQGTSALDLDFQPGGDKLFDSNGTDSGYWLDANTITLVDDVDGDETKEILFVKGQPDMPGQRTVVSSSSGEVLFQQEDHGDNAQTIDWACADFNNDGLADHLFYERWAEGHDGPRLRILNGTGQGTIWEYPDFNSQHLFERMEGFTVMPANPIKDISGDEIPEVALVRILPDQPGAQLLIYDTSSNTELMRIILEEIDPDRKWEEWWHPGILVKEVGDYTSDGRDEVALVVLVGDTEVEKESKLVVVDVAEERTVVDFRAVGPEFVEIAQGRLGLVGLSGEAYFLDMTSDFSIASYAGNGTQGSPVTLSWTGITSGSISQIYVDDLQIAQTDGNQITIDISSGEHEVKIQSLDENGRGVWATEILNISKSPIPIILVFLITLILILIALSIALHINPIETIDWLRTKKRPAND